MHHIFRMRVAKSIGNLCNRCQHISNLSARQYRDTGTVNKLHAEKCTVVARRDIVEFKYSHDVRVHQPNTRLPLKAQSRRADCSIAYWDLERDIAAGHAIFCEPHGGIATGPQFAHKGVAVREFCPAA